MEVKLLAPEANEAENAAIYDVLLQLRPQFNHQEIHQQIIRQLDHGYQLAYAQSGDRILAVVGFVISEKLAWGKHLYVDDFVTNQHCRGTGVGNHVMEWLKAYARGQGCGQIHLDSSVQRFKAHKFYLREGFDIASHHFKLETV